MFKKLILSSTISFSLLIAINYPLVIDPMEPSQSESWQDFSPDMSAPTQVSIVQSTNASLENPVSLDEVLTSEQVLDMVRLAVDMVGGMDNYVSGCSLVVIKPNICELFPSGTGVVTDPAVIRAIAVLVFEVEPDAHVVIGEATGGWVPDSSISHHPAIPVGDGFEVSGYRQILLDTVFEGRNIELVDLNLDPSEEVDVSPLRI